MVQTHENQEEVERMLEDARRRLRQFEERVDYGRLIERLRSSSPAHPVLLARFVFAFCGVMALLCGLAVLLVPFLSPELARELAKVESVIAYVPDDVPALPAVCGVLALCMGVAWAMSTGAALAIGRDSKLLPFEQKQHQQLINEITRLTAIQRIRSNTPAQARPRIATPAPASMRSISPGPVRVPSPARGIAGETSAADGGYGFRRTPVPAHGSTRTPPRASGLTVPESPSPAGRNYPYSPLGAPSRTMPPGPRPGPVPVRLPSAPDVELQPEPIPGRPPSPLSATPRMGSSEMPEFDEGALDEGGDPMIGLADTVAGEDSFSSADDPSDATSPDLLGDPRPAPWDVPASQLSTVGLDASLESSSLVPLTDLDDDLDGPDDIEVEAVAEVEMIESSSIHPALVSEPLLTPIDPETGPIPPTSGPVVYDPAAVREAEISVSARSASPSGPATESTAGRDRPAAAAGGSAEVEFYEAEVRESPAQPDQVRRPAAPSDSTTVRGVPVVDPSATLPHRPRESELLDLPDAGPAHDAEAGEEPPPVTLDTVTDEVDEDDDVTVHSGTPVEGNIAQQGILARARSGSWASRATPFASAGRLRPSGAPARSPLATRGGTPLGAPPQDTARRAATHRPPPAQPSARDEQARKLAALSRLDPVDTEPDDEFEDEAVTVLGAHAAGTAEEQELRWVSVIVAKAQTLARHLPAQAQMAFSQEPHLPFTLVIARATPTVAVRAMMSFVEFLASIPTPPRARIELVEVSHLDRSFHRNVQAALEPHFDRNVIVEPNAGRVDIQFTDPDPRWGRHPTLPA